MPCDRCKEARNNYLASGSHFTPIQETSTEMRGWPISRVLSEKWEQGQADVTGAFWRSRMKQRLLAIVLVFIPSMSLGQAGICYVDGVSHTTLAQGITCAGSSGTIEVTPGVGTLSLPSTATVPAGVTLHIDQGAKLSIASGKTLTVNGPLQIGEYQGFITRTGSPIAITAASETTVSGINTVTISSTLNAVVGMSVTISGVTPAAYNGDFRVLSSNPGVSFTVSNQSSGLGVATAFGTVIMGDS
jgi:hypothetical protein